MPEHAGERSRLHAASTRDHAHEPTPGKRTLVAQAYTAAGSHAPGVSREGTGGPAWPGARTPMLVLPSRGSILRAFGDRDASLDAPVQRRAGEGGDLADHGAV